METIDGKWIARHLQSKRGEKAKLARAMHISNDQMSKILKGVRSVQPDEVPRVLKFFGYEFRPSGDDSFSNPVAEPVKVISWVSAGQLCDQPTIEDFEDFPTIYAADLPPGRWIALTVDGTSMNKISPPSSVILVNLNDTRLVANRCYVVADETGAATYKAYDPKADPPFQPRCYLETKPPVFHGEVRVVGRVYRTMLTM